MKLYKTKYILFYSFINQKNEWGCGRVDVNVIKNNITFDDISCVEKVIRERYDFKSVMTTNYKKVRKIWFWQKGSLK